jgi:hypothetical protein
MPPSELHCRWWNSGITGLAKISANNKRSVAIESVKRKSLKVPLNTVVNMFVEHEGFRYLRLNE